MFPGKIDTGIQVLLPEHLPEWDAVTAEEKR